MTDFVAIDVETANADFSSICQIGIVRYAGGILSEEWGTYVNPEDFFHPFNIGIHGIDESTVQDAPKLYEIAGKIYEYLDRAVVISHTHFDRAALNQAFNKYDLRPPEPVWLDSARVARRTWEKFAWSGWALSNICEEIGYSYRCHDALEDARAAAVVFLTAMKLSGLDVNDWLRRVEQPITPDLTQSIRREGNPAGSLYGNNLVFTGALGIPRREAAEMAARIGCNVQTGVNKDTNVLVVGNQDIGRLAGREKSSKHRRAEELMAKGQEIRVICERDFRELVRLECGTEYEVTDIRRTAAKKVRYSKELKVVITPDGILTPNWEPYNDTCDSLPIEELRAMMTSSLEEDNKREYLRLCEQHRLQAVSVHMELYPEYYRGGLTSDPFDSLIGEATKAKRDGNTEEEIRILESAVAHRSKIPGPYLRLTSLYSGPNRCKNAYEVCKKWFDYGFWKYPQASNSSLILLDHLEKLKAKL